MEAALAYLGTGTAEWSVAASAGLESAGIAATTGYTSAATAGLFGSGGVFSMGSTLMTGATALNTLGTIGGAAARADSARFNSKIAAQNAELAIADSERQAFYIKRNAQDQAAQLEAKQHRAQSSRAAIIGASGLDMQGSPLQVMEGSDYLGELDVAKIINGGEISADNALLRGQRAAAAYTAQSDMDSNRSSSEMAGGLISGGATLLKYGAKRSGYGYNLSMSDFFN
jgi:hypothetical protein